MVIVREDTIFYNENGTPHKGYYMDQFLKSNIDHYFIKAVENKWDCVILYTGMEGSAKTTTAAGHAAYMDPTFPGEPLNDGSPRRKCDRIVFTFNQLMHAIDTAKPGQAIQFDEAVMVMNSQDAASELQKILIKKMTLIRKKRLYILLLIPNMFMLRRYFAVSRTRACVHLYTPDGITRGYFKFYNYDDKRKLYFRGFKEWNQLAQSPSFKGRTTDTSGYFYDPKEYEAKKDEAIEELTRAPTKQKQENATRKRIREDRDVLIWYVYSVAEGLRKKSGGKGRLTITEFEIWIKKNIPLQMDKDGVKAAFYMGRKLALGNSTVGNQADDDSTLWAKNKL